MNKDLTVVIPIKTKNFDRYKKIISLRKNLDLSRVETVIVDDNSLKTISNKIFNFCKQENLKYLNTDTHDERFSISRARNLAIKLCQTPFIYMDDADLVYSNKHFKKILDIIERIDDTLFTYYTIPVYYLSEKQSINLFESEINLENKLLDLKLNLNFTINNSIGPVYNHLKYYLWSGIIASKTKTIKNLGGYNNDYVGWGGEDRDLIFRLINYNNKVTKPENLNFTQETKKIGIDNKYKGWRTFHYSVGKFAEQNNLIGYHIYHPLNDDSDSRSLSLTKSTANINFYYNNHYSLQEKITKIKSKKIVILGRNPFIVNSQLLDELNDFYIFKNVTEGDNEDQILSAIVSLSPKFIFIWNPLSNEHIKKIYLKLIDLNFNVYVVERGGLPNTYYFDNTGFSLTSKFYEEKNWNNRTLSYSKTKFILRYINELLDKINPLERQNENNKKIDFLNHKKKVNAKKYILILFQLENDTATNHYIENGRTYNCFLEETFFLDKNILLIDGWLVLYKNHPLSKKKIVLKNSICVDDCNINQIIKISDVIFTFNSGTGLLGMANKKTVFYYGRCYYAINNVNFKYINFEDFLNKINSINKINFTKVVKFFDYLINDFYSNCETTFYKIKKRKVNRCYYTKINIPGLISKEYNYINDIYKSRIFFNYEFSSSFKEENIKEKFPKRLKKKFKKLIRSPLQFFYDAKIFR